MYVWWHDERKMGPRFDVPRSKHAAVKQHGLHAPSGEHTNAPVHVSMAWPKVWPKFRVARTPPSFSSAATTSALLTQERSMAYVNACRARGGVGRGGAPISCRGGG